MTLPDKNIRQDLNAFVPGTSCALEPTAAGGLSGLRFAAKDLFDIKGYVTGAGNPKWAEDHAPAAQTAPVIDKLLGVGAKLVGKTITDELAFSLDGENAHYGTPLNSACPDRIPGGSSSGSAAAVAGGVVDFALGTDTAGSVRVPASFCGLYGMRPTHGSINLQGVHPLAQSFDTCGWFARDWNIFCKVADVLLPQQSIEKTQKVFIAQDLLALAEPDVQESFKNLNIIADPITLLEPDAKTWLEVFRIIQWSEFQENHGIWVAKNLQSFGEKIRQRISLISTVSSEELAWARTKREELIHQTTERFPLDSIILFPTVPCAAYIRGQSSEQAMASRAIRLQFTVFATIMGWPQITIPILESQGCPVGLSCVGVVNKDKFLLGFVSTHIKTIG